MTIKEFKNAAEGKNIDDFVRIVKKMPAYGIYKEAVNEEEDNTAELLRIYVLMYSFEDKELDAIMIDVAMDLLFAFVDQRLRNEILSESEEENAD